jgi:hypothetical protein
LNVKLLPLSVKEVSLSIPPRFGEHNEEIYGGMGLDVGGLKANKII